MKELTIHNMTAGWRNILKYKVQNIISVICLSFGVLCFAITVYIINVCWEQYAKDAVLQGRTEVMVHKKDNSMNVTLTADQIRMVQQLPEIKSLYYSSNLIFNDCILVDGKGHEVSKTQSINYVSVDWLKENNFYSAITGKKVETLKPGTVVMNRRAAKRILDSYDEPLSCKVKFYDKMHTINDVVYSPTYLGLLGDVLAVPETENNQQGMETYTMNVILNDGYTTNQLWKSLQKIMPQYNWHVRVQDNDRYEALLLLFFLIALGGSVLVIGVSGFLKMQLQLFLLRTREMSLRRCNGAKPIQLFYLLCSELAIVFSFVAIVSIAISAGFEAYAMPRLMGFGVLEQLDIETSIIYRTEQWIALATFLASIMIAWITVRRSLKSPLAKTVGRSFTQSTLWNGTMQVVQYSTAVMLFYIISLLYYALHHKMDKFEVADKPEYYKNIVSVNGLSLEILNKVKASPNLELYANLREETFFVKAAKDHVNPAVPGVTVYRTENMEDDIVEADSIHEYHVIATDANAFNMFHVKVMDVGSPLLKSTKQKGIVASVYAKPEKAKRAMSSLGLKYESLKDAMLYTLPDSNKYVLIGYAEQFPFSVIRYNSVRTMVIDDADEYANAQIVKSDSSHSYHSIFAKAKEGGIDNLQDDIDRYWHEKRPEIPADYHVTMPTCYDSWFTELKIIDFISELLWLITIVCLTCIVLTVFSSISLETRGKQKEVAIRKVNGAKTRNITMLFSRYYIVTLSIAFAFAALVGVLAIAYFSAMKGDWPITEDFFEVILPPFLFSIAIITVVTILTVWQKIYKISHQSPLAPEGGILNSLSSQ